MKYSDQDKAQVLAVLDANGGNVRRTARELGMSRTTLSDWRNGEGLSPAVRQNRQEMRDALRGLFQAEATAALEEAKTKREKASYRDLIIAAAVAVDKIDALDAADRAAQGDLAAQMEAIARVLMNRIQDVNVLAQIVDDLDAVEAHFTHNNTIEAPVVRRIASLLPGDTTGSSGALAAPEDPDEGSTIDSAGAEHGADTLLERIGRHAPA